jgi:hypothetical protein
MKANDLNNFDAKWAMVQMILDAIKLNEGLSVNNRLLAPIPVGYMSAFGFGELILRQRNLNLKDSVIEWVFEHFDILQGKLYAGVWINEGLVYLEVSQHITDKQAAIKLAQSTDQIAIWDLENETEIKV